MKARKIVDNVYWLGAIDCDRRLFDVLIPLPDGTSYNAYLVQGSDKTALLDTMDPSMADVLMEQLAEANEYVAQGKPLQAGPLFVQVAEAMQASNHPRRAANLHTRAAHAFVDGNHGASTVKKTLPSAMCPCNR
jgi:hypothetical protein